MKKMKNILGIFIGVCVLGLFASSFVYAQENTDNNEAIPKEVADYVSDSVGLDVAREQAIVVATVNIYNAKIISQNKNNVKINFVIHNKKYVQPGIRYGVQLFSREAGQDIMVDQSLVDEVFSLGENMKITKTFTYSAPSFLNGEYYIQLVSYNQEGLLLSMWFFDEPLTFSGNNQYVELKNCYVHVQGEQDNIKYNLEEGVDIIEGENLEMICDAINHSQKNISAIAQYDMFERSIFSGRKVDKNLDRSLEFKFKSQQEKIITFPLIQPDLAQAYDAKISLVNQNGKAVSNSVIAHYVMQGKSATVHGVRLDKDQYYAGDIAKLFFLISGNAGNFSNARHQVALVDSGMINIVLKNKSGEICSQALKNINDIEEEPVFESDLSIKKDCVDPHTYIELQDKNGKVLYKTDMKVKTAAPSAVVVNNTVPTSHNVNVFFIIIIAIFVIIPLLAVAWFILKNKNIVMIILFLGTVFFIGCANKASADTYYFQRRHIIVFVNWPSLGGDYSVGSSVSVQAAIPYVLSCNNRIFDKTQVKCGINNDDTLVTELECPNDGACHSLTFGTKTFIVPPGCGIENKLLCKLHIYSHEPDNDAYWSTEDIDAKSLGTTASCPVNADCGTRANGQRNGTYLATDTGYDPGSTWCLSGYAVAVSGTFPNPGQKVTWYCAGYSGGTSATCSAKRIVPEPTVDLKINGSNGPITTVPVGGTLNITWASVANATSCSVTSGAGWNYSPPSSPSITGGSDTVLALVTSKYELTCTGPGGSGSDSVQVNICTPSYTYNCITNDSVDCSNPNNCAKNNIRTNQCIVLDATSGSCVGSAAGPQPLSVCETNGVTCPSTTTTVSCPACPNESNWIEVAP